MTATIREWFDNFTKETGEEVEVVCLGGGRWYTDEKDAPYSGWPEYPVRTVTPIADLNPSVLDHAFDDGYGGTDSPNLCAWSPSFVVFSDQYDGAESIQWVPRNPIDHDPTRPGDG